MSQSQIYIMRYHDISAGHRVAGHENKCMFLHGHNYRITWYAYAPMLDKLGRVIDFGTDMKIPTEWLEEHWDHRMLIWVQDPLRSEFLDIVADPKELGILLVPFNPTAENIAEHLLQIVFPEIMRESPATIWKVEVQETRKCSAVAQLEINHGT